MLRTLLSALSFFCACILAGCADSRDPLGIPVEATAPSTLDMWTNRTGARLDPATQKEFSEAQRQIMLALQIEEPGLTPSSLQLRLRERLDGRSVRVILTDAFLTERERLLRDSKIDEGFLERNAKLARLPRATEDQVDRFTEQMIKLRERMGTRTKRIEQIQNRLLSLNPGRTVPSLETEWQRAKQNPAPAPVEKNLI